jgi:hypothetical protein
VQRWERDLGLPVHRIKTPDAGSIVYALKSEVDAWRNRQEQLAAASIAAEGAADIETEPHTDDAIGAEQANRSDVPRWRAWLVAPVPAWIALALAGVAVTAVVYAGAGSRTGTPAVWEYEGRELRAYTDGGRTLWAHSFERVVSRPTSMRGRGMLADVDATGREDLLVPVRFAAPLGATDESDAVVAFRADGSVIWSLQPALKLSTASEIFEGPWRVHDITSGMTTRGPRTWIAYSHHTWWPGFVIEVDPDGSWRLKYVQPGRVYSLTYWRTTTGTWLVAGGTLNEASSASAAVIDVDGLPARWEDEGPALECPTCTGGLPAAMLLIPTSEVTTAMFRPYGWVAGSRVEPAGVQLVLNDGFGNGTLATLSERLQITSVARSDQYWQMHQDLEKQGRLTHPVTECPEHEEPLNIRRRTPADGWSTEKVPLRLPVGGLTANP